MNRYLSAFADGVLTGADVYATIYGHVNGNSHFLGYQADVYSVVIPSDGKPKQRNVPEQVLKGLGDTVGLLALGGIFGVPILFCRAVDGSTRDKKLNALLRDAEYMNNRD